jgi:4-amino-4-deoxy-L-arabinose transferase-like glycosyltransferase
MPFLPDIILKPTGPFNHLKTFLTTGCDFYTLMRMREGTPEQKGLFQLPAPFSFTPSPFGSKVINYALIGIILIALLLRLLYFNENPPALNQDEAMHGYNAFSIIRTQKDHRGYFLPPQMHGFGNIGIVSPLYTYLTAPVVGMFGLNETTTRIVALLINCALIPVIFFLVKRLFHNNIIALFSSIFLILNPWHFHYSRIGHEATLCPFFYFLIILLFYLILQEEKYKNLFPLAGLVLGLSLYTYQVAWVMSPIIVIFLCILFWKKAIKQYKELIAAFAIACVIALPIFWMYGISPEPSMESRLDSVSLFNKPDGFRSILENYLIFFSQSFLFLKGDTHIWTLPGNAQRYGMFHPFIIIFMFAGTIYLIFHFIAQKKKRREIILIIGLLFLYPLPAAATEPIGWSLRAYTLVPVFHIIGGIGCWALIKNLSAFRFNRILQYIILGCAALFVFFQSTFFFINYYTIYPRFPESFGAYQYGMKEVGEYIRENGARYQSIYVTRDYVNQPFIYILFYTRYDPARYQSIEKDWNPGEWGAVNGFDKFYFRIEEEMPLDIPNTLYVTRWKKVLKGKHLLKTITDPLGDVQFRIWE